MLKYLFLLVVAFGSASVNAQVFKCKGADGKVQFSDTQCKAGNQSELIPDRVPVTQQQRLEAQIRGQQMQNEATVLDREKATAQAVQQAQQQRLATEQSRQAVTAKATSSDANAVANCVRDVERRGASQNVKAEMIAACRSAGMVQRSAGISGDAVHECVKNVERTGASEKDKARQIAVCHGGDVQAEPLPPPRRQPTTLTSCDRDGCWDDVGNRYNKAAGGMFRGDGKFCQQVGNTVQCN